MSSNLPNTNSPNLSHTKIKNNIKTQNSIDPRLIRKTLQLNKTNFQENPTGNIPFLENIPYTERKRSISLNEFNNFINKFDDLKEKQLANEIIQQLGISKEQSIPIENLVGIFKEKRQSSPYRDLYEKISDLFIPVCEKVVTILKDARKKFSDLNLEIYANDLDWVINKINTEDIYNCDLNYDFLNIINKQNSEDFQNSMKLIKEYSTDTFNKNKIEDVLEVKRLSKMRKIFQDNSNSSVKNMSTSNILKKQGITNISQLEKDLAVEKRRSTMNYNNTKYSNLNYKDKDLKEKKKIPTIQKKHKTSHRTSTSNKLLMRFSEDFTSPYKDININSNNTSGKINLENINNSENKNLDECSSKKEYFTDNEKLCKENIISNFNIPEFLNKNLGDEKNNSISENEENSFSKNSESENNENSIEIIKNNIQSTKFITFNHRVSISKNSFTMYNNNLINIRDSPKSLSLNLDKYMKKFEEFDFNVFEYSELCGRENVLLNLSDYLFEKNALYCFINKKRFETFIDKIRLGYDYLLPYHNDLHAADVLQTCNMLIKFLDLVNEIQLTFLDVSGFLIAAIIHDFKHPGLNNSYQINSKSNIARKYNDISVLENYHVSAAFKIISHPNSNIFCDLKIEEYRVIRKRIIECVLATDMAKHTKAQTSLRMKVESIKRFNDGENNVMKNLINNLEIDNKFDRQQEILNFLIHSSDISNPTKPFNICKIWTELVMEEFFMQGDLEKKNYLPISFLCDRVSTNIPKSQIGFISNIVLPNFKILALLSDNCNIFFENLLMNIESWKKEDEKNQRNVDLMK